MVTQNVSRFNLNPTSHRPHHSAAIRFQEHHGLLREEFSSVCGAFMEPTSQCIGCRFSLVHRDATSQTIHASSAEFWSIFCFAKLRIPKVFLLLPLSTPRLLRVLVVERVNVEIVDACLVSNSGENSFSTTSMPNVRGFAGLADISVRYSTGSIEPINQSS